jgi:hypothetical protein
MLAETEQRKAEGLVGEENSSLDIYATLIRNGFPIRSLEGFDARHLTDAASVFAVI